MMQTVHLDRANVGKKPCYPLHFKKNTCNVALTSESVNEIL